MTEELLRLAAEIDHDLRSHLQVVTGYCALLQCEAAGPLTARQHEFLTRIETAAVSMQGVVARRVETARGEPPA